MSFFKKLFGKKEEDAPIKTYEDFWNWFQTQAKEFHEVIKTHKGIEKRFIDKISPKLEQLGDGYLFLAGMKDDHTAELILTADGNLKKIAFVEDLVAAAPNIDGWLITALKPSHKLEDSNIKMGDYKFGSENIFFYSNEHDQYPDEIDITIIHDDYSPSNKDDIIRGTYIFLDIYLGELDAIENIDSVTLIEKDKAEKELVPIGKLKEFLKWRHKEFIEKYEGTRFQTDEDSYSIFQGTVEDEKPMLALMNTELLQWDSKASHPWIAILDLGYDGTENNGMPVPEDYEQLNAIEEKVMEQLKDSDGYLNVGRQTANNSREIYFACKDYRKPSMVFDQIEKEYGDRFEINIEIYKDKYWQSFRRFGVH